MGAHQRWAAPFPKYARVCAGTRGHPAPLPSTRWPPAPLPVMSHVQRDDFLYRSHVLS